MTDADNPTAVFARAIDASDVELALTVCHAQVEFSSLLAELEGTTYQGHAGVRRYFADVAAAWDEWRIDIEDVRPAPDGRTVIVYTMHIRGKESGVPLELRMASAWELKDGKLWRSTAYRDPQDAFSAGDASPSEHGA